MTIELFIKMLVFGGALTSLLTEAVKKFCSNQGWECSNNMLALIDAIVVGMGGTSLCYIFMKIPWTANNIICMVLMGVAVWMASMVGYDKIIQLVRQLGGSSESEPSK